MGEPAPGYCSTYPQSQQQAHKCLQGEAVLRSTRPALIPSADRANGQLAMWKVVTREISSEVIQTDEQWPRKNTMAKDSVFVLSSGSDPGSWAVSYRKHRG